MYHIFAIIIAVSPKKMVHSNEGSCETAQLFAQIIDIHLTGKSRKLSEMNLHNHAGSPELLLFAHNSMMKM